MFQNPAIAAKIPFRKASLPSLALPFPGQITADFPPQDRTSLFYFRQNGGKTLEEFKKILLGKHYKRPAAPCLLIDVPVMTGCRYFSNRNNRVFYGFGFWGIPGLGLLYYGFFSGF